MGQEIASTPSPALPESLSPLSPPSEPPSRKSPNFLPSVTASFLVNESKSRVGMSELLWTQCIYLASYTTKPFSQSFWYFFFWCKIVEESSVSYLWRNGFILKTQHKRWLFALCSFHTMAERRRQYSEHKPGVALSVTWEGVFPSWGVYLSFEMHIECAFYCSGCVTHHKMCNSEMPGTSFTMLKSSNLVRGSFF